MITKRKQLRSRFAGYSLAEVLVGSSILMIGIAAACTLSLTMVTQEEGNVRAARALNCFENAMRLYQLGLTPSEALAILPPDPSVVGLTMTSATAAIAGIGTPERVDAQMEFTTMVTADGANPVAWSSGNWSAGSKGSANSRFTDVIAVYRPATRATGL